MGCCFCPPISSLTPVLPPSATCSPLAALLPTPTLLTVLNIYTCLFLSPTLLPLCLLVTPLLSLLHSHSGALQVSRLTSFSSLLVNTYPCFSPRITPVSPPTADAGPLSPCLQLLEIPRLCPLFFHPPATLRANSYFILPSLCNCLSHPGRPRRFSHCFPLLSLAFHSQSLLLLIPLAHVSTKMMSK